MSDDGVEGLRLPKPEDLSVREKDDAMGAYLMMFASWGLGLPLPFINLIASIVYYFVNRKTSRFVAFHSLQALLVHLPVGLVNAGVLLWFILGLVAKKLGTVFMAAMLFGFLLNILYIVFSIIALRWAHKGVYYYVPVFGRLAFGATHGERPARSVQMPENRPPSGFGT